MSHFGPSAGSSGSGGGGGASFDAATIAALPGVASLALADLEPVVQGGVLSKATIQQALNSAALLPTAPTPASADLMVGFQGGAASLFSLAGIVGITLPSDSAPLDTDQLMVRQLAAPNSPKTLTLTRTRNQIAAGAGAAATLALSDTVLGAQAGAGVGATLQQVLDAGGLLAADAAPVGTDKLLANVGGVGKSLLLSALVTSLQSGGGTPLALGSIAGVLPVGAVSGLASAPTLALADTAPANHGGTLYAATVQQILDAYGLAATDSSPADTDKIAVNQGAVAKTLALSALRTQLDLGVAGGRTVNGGTASTDTLTLANNALAVAKFTGVASATDYFQLTSSATGGGQAGPKLAATGSDVTVDMLFDIKGSGARYAWLVNGSSKMDLNSGAGAGASLRVAGDFVTLVGGGRFGDSGNDGIRINNGGTWVDLEVGAAVVLRASAGLGSSTGPICFLPNLSVEPTVNPTSGFYLYVFGGALKGRGSAGTVTAIAAA